MIEIEELAPGEGDAVGMGDTIDIHYRGTFLDGNQFDASYDRGAPLQVTIGKTGLIQGFTMGIQGMRLGEKRKITIPYALAYGEAGRPPSIPPKSDLIFELELVKIYD